MANTKEPQMSRHEVKTRTNKILAKLKELKLKKVALKRELAILQEICSHPQMVDCEGGGYCPDCGRIS